MWCSCICNCTCSCGGSGSCSVAQCSCSYLSTCLSIYFFICPSICLSIYPSFCLSLSLSPPYLSICPAAAWKRSYSARLPHFSNLTTSKLKQVRETSSIFRSRQHQKRSNSARLPSKMKVECRADGLVPMPFAIFRLHLSKLLRLLRKSDTGSDKVLHLSRKIISANLKIWCSKMQPLSRNQRPDPLTSLINMSFVLRLPRKMHVCRSSSNVPRLPSFLEMLQNPHALLTFGKVQNPLRLPRKTTSELPKVSGDRQFLILLTSKCAPRHNGVHSSTPQLPKVLRGWSVLYILTWKCASRHNGVHFFDISTSKSGPTLVSFVHFDFEMCLAPQRRAIFHLSSGHMAPHPPL